MRLIDADALIYALQEIADCKALDEYDSLACTEDLFNTGSALVETARDAIEIAKAQPTIDPNYQVDQQGNGWVPQMHLQAERQMVAELEQQLDTHVEYVKQYQLGRERIVAALKLECHITPTRLHTTVVELDDAIAIVERELGGE